MLCGDQVAIAMSAPSGANHPFAQAPIRNSGLIIVGTTGPVYYEAWPAAESSEKQASGRFSEEKLRKRLLLLWHGMFSAPGNKSLLRSFSSEKRPLACLLTQSTGRGARRRLSALFDGLSHDALLLFVVYREFGEMFNGRPRAHAGR